MERIIITIPDELKDKADEVSKELSLSRASLIRMALSTYLKDYQNNKK